MTFSQRAYVTAAAHALQELSDRGLLKDVGDDLFSEIGNDVAKAALTAALAVDGVALVPVEPTQAMISEGEEVSCASARDNCATIWRAMLAAASEWEERK